MNDLVEWLRAQLDEDARVAIGVGQDESELCWNVSYDGAVRDRDLYIVAQCEPENHEVQTHIACHDPARVLREVTAKRVIVDAVERHLAGHPGPCVDDGGVVLESGLDFQLYGPCERHEEWNRTSLPMLAAQLLASAYSDRPGYREEWAP